MKLGSSMENLILGGRTDVGGMGHFLGQHGTHVSTDIHTHLAETSENAP